MHVRRGLRCLALTLFAACEFDTPGVWTHEIDVGDRKEILAFEVVQLGDDVVWRIEGSFEDRTSRFGRVDVDGREVWTRELGDDEALTGLAATGDDAMVGMVFDRNTSALSLRGFDGKGDTTWSQPWDEAKWGQPDEMAADAKSIYIATADAVIACSPEGEDCGEYFVLPADLAVFELLPFDGDRLLVQGGGLDRFVVFALDGDASTLASESFDGEFVWDVAAAGDVVYITHGNDALTRLTLDNGAAYTTEAPSGLLDIGAAANGDLLAIEIGGWDTDVLTVYSPDFEMRWQQPIPPDGSHARERSDGRVLVWPDAYEFPNLWITAVEPDSR